MRKAAEDYYINLTKMLGSIQAADRNQKTLNFFEGIDTACNVILNRASAGNKMIFIGNGGSAAISSHMSTDFCKNGNIRSMSFNDGPLLTCISNDFGYEYVFEKPIETHADSGDVLIAISSSGNSENIIRGVDRARSKGCYVITLSGFKMDNRLYSSGDLNFYVSCDFYGIVEVAHHTICHCILDSILSVRNRKGTS